MFEGLICHTDIAENQGQTVQSAFLSYSGDAPEDEDTEVKAKTKRPKSR